MKPTEKILNHYGVANQIDKTLEELAELMVALNHFKCRKATAEDVIDELADVFVMCMQMKHYFGNKEVAERFKFKVERQLERIGKHETKRD